MYKYDELRPKVFKEEHTPILLKIHKNILVYLHNDVEVASDVKLLTGTSGDSWIKLACIDYLCELKIIYEIAPDTRIYKKGYNG